MEFVGWYGGQLCAMIVYLVLAAWVKLPGQVVKACTQQREHTKRDGGEFTDRARKKGRGDKSADAADDCRLVEKVSDLNPSDGLVPEVLRLYHNNRICVFKGHLQLTLYNLFRVWLMRHTNYAILSFLRTLRFGRK